MTPIHGNTILVWNVRYYYLHIFLSIKHHSYKPHIPWLKLVGGILLGISAVPPFTSVLLGVCANLNHHNQVMFKLYYYDKCWSITISVSYPQSL